MIEINNLTTNSLDEEFLKGVAKKVLEGENKKRTKLSIALVGERRIKELNKKYRGKNRTTDVLTFSNQGRSPFTSSPRSLAELLGLGEIIICLREVKKNARRYDSPFKKELSRVLIHGILHLLGYEHGKNKKDAERMKKREKFYLSRISF